MFNHKKARPAEDVCIFVHAGAGYHSVQNENLHLQACDDAAKAGMKVLRAGGCAADAVEIAIRILEDREVTNAGYGSNLNVNGQVECDAIVVDHLGRSGACGAVAQIQNPVSLARLILDASAKPLSLRRVPPNLLVGQGATEFAFNNGMPVQHHDFLISPAARERFLRWQNDLDNAARKVSVANSRRSSASNASEQYGLAESPYAMQAKGIQAGVWNDAQPISPMPTEEYTLSPPPSAEVVGARVGSKNQSNTPRFKTTLAETGHLSGSPRRAAVVSNQSPAHGLGNHDGGPTSPDLSDTGSTNDGVSVHPNPEEQIAPSSKDETMQPGTEQHSPEDIITDTVGAIAIDMTGQVACGASSGGIGMKHRGRIGPAALVGVGAAVVPANPLDHEQKVVAAVTSGTGEHMATTTIGAVFAERLYSGIERTKRGHYVGSEDDDEIIRSVISNEFMEHASVRGSTSAGAIGALLIKRTVDGICLYFAHNTDSFAVASQHVGDARPLCTMSRGRGNGSIAQGGRIFRSRHAV